MPFCRNCGRQISETAIFCPQCGFIKQAEYGKSKGEYIGHPFEISDIASISEGNKYSISDIKNSIRSNLEALGAKLEQIKENELIFKYKSWRYPTKKILVHIMEKDKDNYVTIDTYTMTGEKISFAFLLIFAVFMFLFTLLALEPLLNSVLYIIPQRFPTNPWSGRGTDDAGLVYGGTVLLIFFWGLVFYSGFVFAFDDFDRFLNRELTRRLGNRITIMINNRLEGVKYMSGKRSSSSFWIGVLIGIVAMIVLSFIPVIGPILAGLAAGIVAGGGAGRGALAGFLSGILGAIIAAVLLGSLGSLFGGILGGLIGGAIGTVLIIASLLYAILGLIGGAIGGILRK